MTEKTRKKIVFLALPLAIIWAVYNYQPNDKKKIPQQTSTDSAMTMDPATSANTTTPEEVPKKLIDIEKYENLPWGKDPFHAQVLRQKQTKTVSKNNWTLSGIIYNAANPVAIINKKTVKTGDIIDNAKVIEIARRKVVLDYGGNRITLTVTRG